MATKAEGEQIELTIRTVHSLRNEAEKLSPDQCGFNADIFTACGQKEMLKPLVTVQIHVTCLESSPHYPRLGGGPVTRWAPITHLLSQ